MNEILAKLVPYDSPFTNQLGRMTATFGPLFQTPFHTNRSFRATNLPPCLALSGRSRT